MRNVDTYRRQEQAGGLSTDDQAKREAQLRTGKLSWAAWLSWRRRRNRLSWKLHMTGGSASDGGAAGQGAVDHGSGGETCSDADGGSERDHEGHVRQSGVRQLTHPKGLGKTSSLPRRRSGVRDVEPRDRKLPL